PRKGTARRLTIGQELLPCAWNVAVAATFCRSRAIRIVPLAVPAGMPRESRAGRVSREPPPARALAIPEAKPSNERRIQISQECSEASIAQTATTCRGDEKHP